MVVRGLVPVVILSIAACGGPQAQTVAAPPAVKPVAEGPKAAPTAPVDDPNADLVTVVCAERTAPCEKVEVHDAGKDPAGRQIAVALFLVDAPARAREKSAAGTPEPKEDAGGNEAGTNAAPKGPKPLWQSDEALVLGWQGEEFETASPCFTYEYWRVTRENGTVVAAHPIVRICNDKHAPAHGLADKVVVEGNQVRVSSSTEHGRVEVTYSLSPFVRRMEHSVAATLGVPGTEASWISWEDFEGDTEWTARACGADGRPLDLDDESAQVLRYKYSFFPMVDLQPGFVAAGWKTTPLDECAASIDAAGNEGHVIAGEEAADAADAQLRLVAASSGELFVQVADDKIVGPSARAASDDHLEVWAAPGLPAWDAICIDPKVTTGVVAWDVRIADGKVTAGFGKPDAKSLRAERATDPEGTARFKLRLPAGLGAVTLVYADSDGGGKIERRIATSALAEGRRATLGKITDAAGYVRCTQKPRGLVPELQALLPVKP